MQLNLQWIHRSAWKSGKGQGPTKGKNKMSEPCPGTSLGTGSAGSSKNIVPLFHWSKNYPYYNFCDMCKVTTHSTHMCRASQHGNERAGSPLCIYCGKTNHRSAYCRYRLRDNHEELRNTPDALRTGTNGKNSALVPRNQTGSTPHNNNNVPFSHSDGRTQSQPNRGHLGPQPRGQYNGSQQGPKHRDQTGAAPRGQQTGTNPSFPPRGQQHTHFNEGFNRRHSPPTFPSPGFNNTMASDAVGKSIIHLAENQSHSLDFILAGQHLQMDAYKEMTCSNQAKEDDALFARIQVYDGEDPSSFEGWLDAVEQMCNMTDRNLRKELMKKLTAAIRETLSMMNPYWTDNDVISKLRQDFSSMSTVNRGREELRDLKQLPGQPISSYMYKYGRIHFLATGNQAQNERYPTAIMEFIELLNPKIMRALAKKHADPRTRTQTLQQAFNMAEEASRRILETESFERSSTVRFSGSVNHIYKPESVINEVSWGKYDNYNKGGYKNNYNKDMNNYYNKKDWNRDNMSSYQKKDGKKESKDKDVYLTLTKDVKFHCPAGFDDNIFACACRMIQETVNSTRQSGITDIKTVNAVEKDNFMCMFLIFQRMCMIQHGLRLWEKRTLEQQGTFLIDYRKVTHWKTI